MQIEKTWYASSRSEELEENQELINIAGQWNARIRVEITNPYIYSRGPIETETVKENQLSHLPGAVRGI